MVIYSASGEAGHNFIHARQTLHFVDYFDFGHSKGEVEVFFQSDIIGNAGKQIFDIFRPDNFQHFSDFLFGMRNKRYIKVP